MNLGYKSVAQKQKKLRYGGYSAIATLIVTVLLVLATVLVELLDLTVDLSPNKMYTTGSTTQKVLDELENNIDIYGLFTTGTEEYSYYAQIVTLAEQYGRVCDKVTYETVDTLKNPEFIKQYLNEGDSAATIDDGSFMVLNRDNGKYRILGLYDFYGYLSEQSESIDSFCAEEAFTSAIQYVTSNHTPVVYQLTGHGEAEVNSTFLSYMRTTNCDFETLNLLSYEGSAIPVTSYTILMMNAPTADLLDREYEMVLNYLERGGRMMIFLSYETSPFLTNFGKLLNRFGISYNTAEGYVLESEMSHYYWQPFIVLPTVNTESKAAEAFDTAKNHVTLLYSVPLTLTQSASGMTETEVFLSSSDTAVLSASQEKVGPFALAVSVREERNIDGKPVSTRLIVFGDSQFVDYNQSTQGVITTGNYKLVASSISSLQDDIDVLYITGKSMTNNAITVSATDFVVGFLIFVILIPVAVLAIGLVIWLRRKHL